MQKWQIMVRKIGLTLVVLALGMWGWRATVSAQTLSTSDFMPTQVKVQQNPGTLVRNAVNLVFVISAALAFFFLIYGSIQWLTSGGDSSKIEAARKNLLGAIVGLLILASTWAIFTLVMQIAFGEMTDLQVPALVEGGGGNTQGGGNNTQSGQTNGGTEAYTCGSQGQPQPGTCPDGYVCRQYNGTSYSCQSPTGERV